MMVHMNESPNFDTSRYSCVNLSQDSCDKIKEANWACIKATPECSENDTSSATFTAKPVTTKASLFCTVIYCMLISCSFIYNVISREAVMSNDLHVGGLFIVVSCVVLVLQLLYYFLSTENIEKGETVEKEFAIILKEVRKNFGTTTATDISLVKEHVSRYAKDIHFLHVDSEQIAQVNRPRRDREPSRITKRHLPHVFSKSRKEGKHACSYLMINLPRTSKLCHVTRCSFSHREKYSSYLKYAFKSRKYKTSFHSGGGFFKMRKKNRKSCMSSTFYRSFPAVNVYTNHTHRMAFFKYKLFRDREKSRSYFKKTFHELLFKATRDIFMCSRLFP